MKSHEYIVICGVNRSWVGKTIGVVASLFSALIIYALFKLVEFLKLFNIESTIPPSVFSLISAGGLYVAIYAWFNSSLWKGRWIAKKLNVPDLSGTWEVSGEGRNLKDEVVDWFGEMKIHQSWDKVHIRLDTRQSGSDSIAASIIYDEGVGYRLIYNYRNDPRIIEKEIHSHMGFAEFTFNDDLTNANGEYFNGRGRNTFGTMNIRRK
ncbi:MULTISPECIES: hypothetical protein [unclassified Serratia (in: enterobacteria)]|uniref:Cap15 family cyclic dinucleotide receptor domain-containing protein n=1 Tax=unclassified Serratia (in: enterobacteria) TaxID=2647522 RepID=UPI0039BFC3FC